MMPPEKAATERPLATTSSRPGDPPSPQSLDDMGIPSFLMQDLALRYLREHGTASLTMLRKGLKLSYIDHHMSAAVTTPELRDRFVKVARDYKLGISRWYGEQPGPIVYPVPPSEKTQFLLDGLQHLDKPGLYLIVCHTLIRTPEVDVLHDLNPVGPKPMAAYRQAECDMLCDPRLKQLLKDKNIDLVGYDTLREKFLDQLRPPAE